MKKHLSPFATILIIVTGIFLLNPLEAQDCDVLFYYFDGGSTRPVLTDLTADNGYILAGSTDELGADGYDIQVVKVDQFGNEVWSKLFGTAEDETATDIEVLDDGYLVLGYSGDYWDPGQGYLLRLDLNGNILWEQFFGQSYEGIAANSVMVDDEGNFVIAGMRNYYGSGWYPDSEAIVYKTDPSGNLLNEQAFNFWIPEFENLTLFDGFGNMRASSVIQTNDGNYLFTGLTVPRVSYSPIKGNTIIFKTDKELNNIWHKDHYTCDDCQCQADGVKTVEDAQGNLYLSIDSKPNGCYDGPPGYLEVLKLDADGNPVWDTDYIVGKAHDIIIASDGNLVINSLAGLIKLSTEGEIIWEKPFDNYHWTRGANSLKQKTDGGFVVSGYRYNAGGELFLALTDSLGNSCTNLVEGYVFYDADSDCLFDSSEHALPQFLVELNPGPLFDLSDESGYYRFITDSGHYTVTIHPLNSLWSSGCPASQIYDVHFAGFYENSDSTDFAMIPAGICPLMDIDMSWSSSRICNDGSIMVQFCNFGAAIEENLSISLTLPDELTFLDANYPWTQNGNSFSFDIGNLGVGECGILTVQDSVKCDANLGDQVCLSVQAFPDDPCAGISPLTTDTICRILTNSYDPNDKLGFVKDRENCFDPDVENPLISYTIRFQNTGNDTAYRVMIADTLSEAFDIRTLDLGPASHAYTFEILDTNILIWTFDAINLPDSATDLSGSQGSLKFSIQANSQAGVPLINEAAIYFDANPPIFTPASEINECISNDFTISGIVSNATCDICNGHIDITIEGNSGPYSYNWFPVNSFQEDLLDLCSGIYTVMVTDAYGVVKVASFEVGQDEPILISFTTLSPLCEESNGEIALSVTGGNPPYAYSWFGPGGAGCPPVQNQTGLGPGQYSVTVTDALGCTEMAIIDLDTQEAMAGSLNIVNDHCGDCSGSIDLEVQGGTGPFTYIWSHGSLEEDPSGLCEGVYTVTVVDVNGCVLELSTLVEATGPLQYDLAFTNTTCSGACDASILLSTENGTAPYIYEWSAEELDGQQEIFNLCAGVYAFTVTDALGCTISSEFTIEEPEPLLIDATAEAICYESCNGQIEVSVSGGTPPYDHGDLVDLCPGTYQVLVTDAYGCSATEEVTIAEIEVVSVEVDTIGHTPTGSAEGLIQISVLGGVAPYGFIWLLDNNEMVGFEQHLSEAVAGSYTVLVTDQEGCIFEFGPYVVESLVSAQEQFLARKLSVFPNPSQGVFNIQFDANYPTPVHYEVFDLTGKTIKQGILQTPDNEMIELTQYSEGVYLLKLNLENGTITRKLLLVK